MKKKKKYCCFCGGTISRKTIDGRKRDYCRNCKTVFYENPLPVACCIVSNENREVLLVKRKKDPYKDMWCLPIGFAESGEEVSQAALRELSEETGLTGEIVRLIDVDTVENYFYGSLAIVTYEVRATGGVLKPGDDATDAAYFPISSLPELAWSSNEKALEIFRMLYKDTWAMMDSFRQLFPGALNIEGISAGNEKSGAFLSNLLIKIIDMDMDEISSGWIKDVLDSIPGAGILKVELSRLNSMVLSDVRSWLKGSEVDYKKYVEFGKNIRKETFMLAEILTALALSRKSIWLSVIKKRILSSPLEIYSTLELNNRIIFFYDRINYFITKGYSFG
ncbi:MAG TPA: NUDIX hydrolase [Desulfomonilia bacterium]